MIKSPPLRLLSSVVHGQHRTPDHLRALRLRVRKAVLAKHQNTSCVRCGGVLQRFNGLTVEQRLALTFTAAMLWLFANFYPVMSISLKGLKTARHCGIRCWR